MESFWENNKKKIKIGIAVLLIILIISIIWLFILPSFKTNKYGNRLKDEKKYKVSNDVISKIKDKAKENDSIEKIDYHKEGRILNFIITVDSNLGVDQAKEFAGSILGDIDDSAKSYYDIQVLFESNEKSDNYPIIGYKSKSSEGFNYGNVGG